MIKRVAVVYLLAVLILSVGVFAQSIQQQIDSGTKSLEEGKAFIEDKKWEYISQEWEKIVLQHPVFGKIHTALQKTSPLFIFFFGQPYALSLTLVFAILIWIFFANTFANVFRAYSPLSAVSSYAVGVCMAIISAHLGFYSKIATVMFKILFYKEGVWRWVIFGVMLVVYVLIILYIRSLGEGFHKLIKERKEKMKKIIEETDRELLHIETKSFDKTLKKVSDAMNDRKS